jgi:hypothetical protein
LIYRRHNNDSNPKDALPPGLRFRIGADLCADQLIRPSCYNVC